MAISLRKNFTSARKTIEKKPEFILCGLGWDMRRGFGDEYDLDISCFLVSPSSRVIREKDFIFYNNPKSSCRSVLYSQDNIYGEGDDEKILIDLPKIPDDIERVVFAVSIYGAQARGQRFGMLSRALFYVKNRVNNEEIFAIGLNEAYPESSAVFTCEFFRHDRDWRFRPLNNDAFADLAEMAASFGLETYY